MEQATERGRQGEGKDWSIEHSFFAETIVEVIATRLRDDDIFLSNGVMGGGSHATPQEMTYWLILCPTASRNIISFPNPVGHYGQG